MIMDEFVIIKPNNHSVQHYIDKGYDAKCRKFLLVKVEDLTLSSNVKINCVCDICSGKTYIKYQDYNKVKHNYNLYTCIKCKISKIKMTKLLIYGDENYNNIGKIEQTNIERYGFRYALQNEDIYNKMEETNLKKYGVNIASKNDTIKNKIKLSLLEKFKDENERKLIIEKRIQTCIVKYGVHSFTQTDSYKIKSKETCLKKYGYEHNGSVPEFIEKRKISKLKNHPLKEKNDFKKYKSKVLSVTRKNLKTLFENWNGYDYYDQEYIKDYFLLDCRNKLYPTIDHKLSIFYGFKNNIDVEIIGDIENLCITKKTINSSKRDKIFVEK